LQLPDNYLQQLAGLGQSAFLMHLPLLQLVQFACLALTFFTGALSLAIIVVAANNIASILKLNFFIWFV
jgi:hypothetical protein